MALGDSKKVVQFSVDEEYSPNYAKDLNGKFKIKGVFLENKNEWEYFGTCKSKKRKF